MTTLDTTTLRAARNLTLPQPIPVETHDRSRAAAPISPAQAVQVAARAISRSALQPVCSPASGMAFHPRALLAVLTYCYASEIYSSTDIEDLMRRDANFRAICGNQIPDAQTLRRFRRHNREALEHCLYYVLQLLADQADTHPTEVEFIEQSHQKLVTAVLMDLHDD